MLSYLILPIVASVIISLTCEIGENPGRRRSYVSRVRKRNGPGRKEGRPVMAVTENREAAMRSVCFRVATTQYTLESRNFAGFIMSTKRRQVYCKNILSLTPHLSRRIGATWPS